MNFFFSCLNLITDLLHFSMFNYILIAAVSLMVLGCALGLFSRY